MRLSRPSLLAPLALALVAVALPVAGRIIEVAPDPDADPLDAADATWAAVAWPSLPMASALLAMVLVAACCALLLASRRADSPVLVAGSLAGTLLPFTLLRSGLRVGPGAWLVMIAALLLLWRLMVRLSATRGAGRTLVVPALFGLAVLYLWEVLVRGFAVPLILLPPPSLVATTLFAQAPVLIGDFVQTMLRSALRGYVIGCAAGFGLAILCDRFPTLGRGLLPYGNLLSAVPMVGIAPIMIMWFGFGWESKAAVVVVTTLFPMLVNTLAGLAEADRLQLDLMRSYGAGYAATLLKVRLPMALPFVFTALKINSTFALIGAIVAEFFGTPIAGMGFRISTEVARMNLGMVWATIAVAALTGSAAYGALALVERAATSWHPSYRDR